MSEPPEIPPATIADVAREAGVSTATVSRMLNGLGTFKDETRQKVHRAVEQLNYVPNRKHRRRFNKPRPDPVRKRQGQPTIAFVRVGEFMQPENSPVTSRLMDELGRQAANNGIRLTFHTLPGVEHSLPVREVIGNAQGVLLRTSNNRDTSLPTIKWLNGIPAVQLLGQNKTGRLWIDHVTPDNLQAGALAAEYLIDRGASRLVFSSAERVNRIAFDRCVSFVHTAVEEGKEAIIVLESFPGGEEELKRKMSGIPATCIVRENREDVLMDLFARSTEPTGLFIPKDFGLALVLTRLRAKGIDLNTGFYFIGCNFEPRSLANLSPAPATLDLQVQNIAFRAMRRLLYRMEHPEEPLVRLSVAPEIVQPEQVMIATRVVQKEKEMPMASTASSLTFSN